MTTLKELRERQGELLARAREKLDEIKDDTDESRAKEIEGEYDRIMADHDKLEVRAKKEEALVAAEARQQEALNRPDPRRPTGDTRHVSGAGDPPASPADAAEKRRKVFEAYLRRGLEGVAREERVLLVRGDVEDRAMGVAVGTSGGYLAPDGFMPELIKTLKMWGPMMDPGITRMMNTGTGVSIPWPTMDDTSNTGALIAENTQVSQSEVTFGTRVLNAYKYTSGVVLVASELLQDAALDVEQIVRDAMAERIGRIGNTHLTTGDGSSKPTGIMTAAGAGYSAASATAIVLDDLIELEHSVDPAYRSTLSCRWMFNDATLKALRKLKDGAGNYIWQPPSVATGTPATLLNYPYVINQAVANIGTGNRSVAFGDFSRYITRMVNQFSIRRLDERYADFDQVGFIGFARMDGNLMDAGAVKRLLHP